MYPPLCPLCGRLLPDDEPLCPACVKTLPRTEQDRMRGNLTEEKLLKIPRLERSASFLYYTPSAWHVPFSNPHLLDAGRLLRLIKYSNRPDLATYLAQLAADEWAVSGFFRDIDLIIPVPLHARRLRERGYNQSLYIARGLSLTTKIPVDTEHLVRLRNNPHQARMGENERVENVRGLFQVLHPEELRGRHILLVDDIITTGNTMRACLQPLTRIRSCRFSVFALAVTRPL